jgi:hypothetical protein
MAVDPKEIEGLDLDQLKEKFSEINLALGASKTKEAELEEKANKLDGEATLLHKKVKELETKAGASVSTGASGRGMVYVAHDRKIEKLRGPPKPSSRDPEIDERIGDIRGVISSRKLTEPDAVQYIKDHLGGDAREEIESRKKDSVQKPEQIFKILREVFEFSETLPQLRRRFYSRVQKEGETILQYSHGLTRLHRRMEQMDPSLSKERDEAMKSQLVDGVRDPELQREALRWWRERKGTFFELRDWAAEWSRQGNVPLTPKSKVGGAKEASAASMSGNEPLLQVLKQQNDMLQAQLKAQEELTKVLRDLGQSKPKTAEPKSQEKPTPRYNQGDRRWGVCFNCQDPSHQYHNCPKPRDPSKLPEWYQEKSPVQYKKPLN